MREVIPIVLMLSLVGCATYKYEEQKQSPTRVEEIIKERTVVIDTACDWVRPVYVSKDDVFTPGTARQILAHNETWEAQCKKKEKTSKEAK